MKCKCGCGSIVSGRNYKLNKPIEYCLGHNFKVDRVVPWNKGLKGIHLSPKTEFKKGRKMVFTEEHRKKISEIRKRLFKEGKLKIKWNDERRKKHIEMLKKRDYTEEMRKKVRKTWKRKYENGYVNNMKGKAGGMKGKHHSLESREKISQNHALKGKENKWGKHTEQAKRKISLANKGEKSNFWKGGITPLNNQIRHSFQNKSWILKIFKRDKYTCNICDRKRKKGDRVIIVAHHIKPFYIIRDENHITTMEDAINCEKLWDINNGITLCNECHNLTENRVNQYTMKNKTLT